MILFTFKQITRFEFILVHLLPSLKILESNGIRSVRGFKIIIGVSILSMEISRLRGVI